MKNNLTRRDKAAKVLAKLERLSSKMMWKEIEDIEYSCSEKELDFYYFWIVQGGKINGYDT